MMKFQVPIKVIFFHLIFFQNSGKQMQKELAGP